MPREMFGDVVDPSIKVGTKQWYTVPLSILTHTVVLGALVVIPLLATDMLPTPQSVHGVRGDAAAAAAAAPATAAAARRRSRHAAGAREPERGADRGARRKSSRSRPRRRASAWRRRRRRAGGIPGGALGGVVGGIAPPPPPPPPAAPVRVGGDIKEPKKIKDVKPVYPPIAQTAKVQGIVIIEADHRQGRRRQGREGPALGQPLLDQAALDAVKQWRYTPTLLNGQPVEVIMTVTVKFTLN